MTRLSIALLACAFATPALADTTNLSTRGDWVSASYYDYAGGCGATYVTVSAHESVEHASGSGAPTTASSVYVYVGDYNYCTGTFSYYMGTLDNATVSASTGTVSGSGTLYDYYSGAPLAVTLSASVSGDGGSYQGISNTHSSMAGVTYHYRSIGSYTYGDASITVNGTTYTQAGGGSYGRTNSGTLTITEN